MNMIFSADIYAVDLQRALQRLLPTIPITTDFVLDLFGAMLQDAVDRAVQYEQPSNGRNRQECLERYVTITNPQQAEAVDIVIEDHYYDMLSRYAECLPSASWDVRTVQRFGQDYLVTTLGDYRVLAWSQYVMNDPDASQWLKDKISPPAAARPKNKSDFVYVPGAVAPKKKLSELGVAILRDIDSTAPAPSIDVNALSAHLAQRGKGEHYILVQLAKDPEFIAKFPDPAKPKDTTHDSPRIV